MIVLARESRGLTQSELAVRSGTSQSHLSKVETGALLAPRDMLEALSRVLDYPVEFFYSTEGVYGPSTSEFFHRKRTSVAAKVMAKIHALINVRRIHVERLAKSADLPPISIPRLDPDEFGGDVEEIARAVRAMWQLPRGPVKSVAESIENAGGVIVRMRFDTNKVDAVSWWIPGNPPMFVVNESMPADRERMTLCHELGHLVMHTVVRPHMEEEANRFAGAFLMPADDIRDSLRDASLRSLAALKPYWRVSMAALLTRAVHTGAIQANKGRYLWAQFSRAGYRMREPGELNFPKESAGLLQELVDLHVNDLGYDVHQFARVIGWTEHEAATHYRLGRGAPDPKSRFRVVK